MSQCNLTTQINGTDCIGDSRGIINQNFTNLDNAVCSLSGAAFLRNAYGGLVQTDENDVTLLKSLRSCYNFIPISYNTSDDPYFLRQIASYSGSNITPSGQFQSPVQTVKVVPTVPPYSWFDTTQVDAVLVKIRVSGDLYRDDGSITLQTRKSSVSPWYTVFRSLASGAASKYTTNTVTTEILYFDKTTGQLDWKIYDDSTSTLSGTATYNITIELLGYYFNVESPV